MLPPLFRSLLPLENPIGFGLQDFLELALAVLLVGFSLIGWRLMKTRGVLADLLPLLAAFCAAHFFFAFAIGSLRPEPEKPTLGHRLILPQTRPVPMPAPVRKTEPPRDKKSQKRQISPFEEVK